MKPGPEQPLHGGRSVLPSRAHVRNHWCVPKGCEQQSASAQWRELSRRRGGQAAWAAGALHWRQARSPCRLPRARPLKLHAGPARSERHSSPEAVPTRAAARPRPAGAASNLSSARPCRARPAGTGLDVPSATAQMLPRRSLQTYTRSRRLRPAAWPPAPGEVGQPGAPRSGFVYGAVYGACSGGGGACVQPRRCSAGAQ